MRRTQVVCVVLAIAAAVAFVAARNSPPTNSQTQQINQRVRFASGKDVSKIPFELVGNLILVQLRVNTSDDLRFIVDTGAETSVIDAQRAKALRLPTHGKMVGSGGAGSAEATFTNGVSVTLPGIELLDRTIYVLPLDSLSGIGRQIDGVLGNDILKEFAVGIDYAARNISFHEPQTYRYAGPAETIPWMMKDGLLFVRARVTLNGRAPIDATFEVDSGSSGAILLNTPFVNSNKVLATVPKTIQTSMGGVGGQAKMLIGRIDRFTLGRFVIDRPITRFSRARQGDYASAKYDGLIGGEMLRRFNVVFEYSRGQMTLVPNPGFADPYEVDMSGITLVADGDDLLIDDVSDKSAAAAAGVQGGDVLVAIDGRPARELSIDDIRTMFMQDGKDYVLSLKRNNKTLQTRIKLKRIV